MTIKKEAKRLDFIDVALTSIIAALVFLVGLFWRDAVSETIKTLVPEGQGLAYQYIAAIIVTIIAVVLIYILSRIQKKY